MFQCSDRILNLSDSVSDILQYIKINKSMISGYTFKMEYELKVL